MEENSSKKALMEFISEAEEIVDNLDGLLIELADTSKGGGVDPDILNQIFREAHTLKGVSGMYGFEVMSGFSHNLENILDRLRLGKVKLDSGLINILMESVQLLKGMINEERDDSEEIIKKVSGLNSRFGEFLEDVKMVSPKEGVEPQVTPEEEEVEEEMGLSILGIDAEVLKVLTEYEEHRLRENINMGRNIFKVHVAFEIDSFDRGLEEFIPKLKKVGEVISTLPSAGKGDELSLEFDILTGSELGLSDMRSRFRGEEVEIEQVMVSAPEKVEKEEVKVAPIEERIAEEEEEEGVVEEKDEKKEISTPTTTTLRSKSSDIKVDIGRLDNLMNIVGELILHKVMLEKAVDDIKTRHGSREVGGELLRSNKNLGKKLKELQDRVMEVRLVPLRLIFNKLMREVRKTKERVTKDINVIPSGEDTELDKLIIEDLVDPLMHIIRNSIDHGIEKKGNIYLRAFQRGNHVVIEVEDDGVGMDPIDILDVAVERRMEEAIKLRNMIEKEASEDEELAGTPIEKYRKKVKHYKEEIFQFIFEPGFSTKTAVSELSGRGVGMNVVKKNISDLSGIIDVDSEPNQGTKISLTLPITLAILQVLIVEVFDRSLAIPLTSVLETIEVNPNDITIIEKSEVIQLRERNLSLLRLDRYFGLDNKKGQMDMVNVVVVGYGEKAIGLVVDNLIGQRDVVIKSLGRLLKDVKGFAGAADLGAETILVLDIGELIDQAMRKS